MAKGSIENTPGHITEGNVLADLGFTAEEIRETEIKIIEEQIMRIDDEAESILARLVGLAVSWPEMVKWRAITCYCAIEKIYSPNFPL